MLSTIFSTRKRSLLLSLFLGIFLFGISSAYADFKDVANTHPNFLAIKYLSDTKIFNGYSDGTFKPEKIVNKAEALKLILESIGAKIEDTSTASEFRDVKSSDWFAKYISVGKAKRVVSGNPDGTFTPGKSVTRAEFLKMTLIGNNFKDDNWKDKSSYTDVPKDAWFTAYMNFAGASGLITKSADNKLEPNKPVSRAEAAEILYLLRVILKGTDVSFLVSQSEAQIIQIEVYMNAYNVNLAKRASDLALDMTQQALKQRPSDATVLSAAKIAKSYSLLLSAFIAGYEKNKNVAIDLANQSITKANEAQKANASLATIVKHIKDRANDIISQAKKL